MSQNVAVVGSGIAGLAAASHLAERGYKVTLFEADSHIGGHAWTQTVSTGTKENPGPRVEVDVGFQVFNQVTYPNMLAWFERYGVVLEKSDMSLAVSVDNVEWSSSGLSGVFAQKRNALNPWFHYMIYDVVRFKKEVLAFLDTEASACRLLACLPLAVSDPAASLPACVQEKQRDYTLTLGEWLGIRKYSQYFISECNPFPSIPSSACSCVGCAMRCLIAVVCASRRLLHHPSGALVILVVLLHAFSFVLTGSRVSCRWQCASVWSCPADACMKFPAWFLLTFMKNHHLLQLVGRPQWLTVAGRSKCAPSHFPAHALHACFCCCLGVQSAPS